MAKFKYTCFYDFHTSTILPNVGENFDVEKFTGDLAEAGVDYLTWHARCNQGNAYYDTEIGCKHPALKRDLFGEIVRSCHRKGIRVSAYFNGGLSDAELLLHREWMRISPDGSTMSVPHATPEMRAACYNSPFRDHLKKMVREVAEKYPEVDGFFFDCMSSRYACICPVCVQEMIAKGIDYTDRQAVVKFTEMSAIRLANELYDLVKELRPDGLFFLNGELTEPMIGKNTQFECECLPPCKWLGYDYLPVHAHYLRTIAGDNSVLCMTGRFYDWGDFGGLRREESVEYDLLYGMANGMRPEIADHYHPRGDRYGEVSDMIKRIYKNLQQYDPWVLDAVNRPNVALVRQKYDDCLKAATRMLTEMKLQFDIVSEAAPWDGYDLLIFADNIVFNAEITARVKAHLARGGKIIATGFSGLDEAQSAFTVPAWPAVYRGRTPHDPAYFQPEGSLAQDLPSFPLSVYASAAAVQAAEGAAVEMYMVKPYHNRAWDGLHSNFYCPPQEKTQEPFLAGNDQILYCTGEICKGYFERAPHQSRLLLENMIRRFLPRPKFRSSTLPSYARAFVQYRKNEELLHVMCYMPELRGCSVALEERGTLVDSVLSLRVDPGTVFRKVYLAPSGEELSFTVRNGYCTVNLPLLNGYALLVFEKESV